MDALFCLWKKYRVERKVVELNANNLAPHVDAAYQQKIHQQFRPYVVKDYISCIKLRKIYHDHDLGEKKMPLFEHIGI